MDAAAAVAALEGLGLEALRSQWRVRYGAPPPLRSPELLAMMLSWRIQSDAEGGLGVETRRALRRPVAEGGRPTPRPSSGTKLVREWQGVRHEVTVVPEGAFVYRGERFRSLSQVARAITGTRWNGPRFFGLRNEEAAS
jgi:hypothetical protein